MKDLVATTEPVRLSIPPDASYVRLARLVVSGLGAQVDLSVDHIDDLRLAVDEMCMAAIAIHDGADLELQLKIDRDAVRIVGSSRYRSDPPAAGADNDELSWMILDAVVDERSFEMKDGDLRFTLVKYRGK